MPLTLEQVEAIINGLSNCKDMKEMKEYVLQQSPSTKKCLLCDNNYSRLKTHLGSCIKAFLSKHESEKISPLTKTKEVSFRTTESKISGTEEGVKCLTSELDHLNILDDTKEMSSRVSESPISGTEEECFILDDTSAIAASYKAIDIVDVKNSEITGTKPKTQETKVPSSMSELIHLSQNEESFKNLSSQKEEIKKELKSNLDKIKISMNDTKTKSDTVNRITNRLFKWLKENDDIMKWSSFPSGSYYERLKINTVDEIDYMVVCKIPCIIEYNSTDKMFLQLKVPEDKLSHYTKICTAEGYISPKLFIRYFRELLDQATGTLGDIIRPNAIRFESSLTSPAITLKKRNELDIDFVPAIELPGWPEVSQDFKLLPKFTAKSADIRSKFHAVGKIHHSELGKGPADCKLWRLSFSCAEKKIMLHLDSETCRKDVLRLLKWTFDESSVSENYVASYFLKTVVLHMVHHFPGDLDWQREHLVEKYVLSLLVLHRCFDSQYLEHAFIKGANLLSVDYLSNKERDQILKCIKEKMKSMVECKLT